MSDAYTVILDDHGCPSCSANKSWTVMGPDDTAIPNSFSGENALDEAESVARMLNTAYSLGRDVWQKPKLFTEEPPVGDVRVLAWDDELKLWNTLWWHTGKVVNTEFLKLRYTVWIPELPPPDGATPDKSIPAPVISDLGDDIPF